MNGTLMPPYTTWQNYTYATSCSWDDSTCYSVCLDYVSSCEAEWAAYANGAASTSTRYSISTVYHSSSTTVGLIESTTTYTFVLSWSEGAYTQSSVMALASNDGSISVSVETRTFTYNVYSYINSRQPPSCSTTASNPCTRGCNTKYCTVQGGNVDLLYWPVATTSLHVTDGSTSTEIIPITGNPNTTSTMLFEGTTLISPTVYISFETAFALDECSKPVDDSFCSTIFTDYRPVLSVPQQILSLDPAWSSCDVYWRGLYDPPKALQPAQVVMGPTTPAGDDQAKSTSAVPENSLVSPTVKPTIVSGDPPQVPTATQDPSKPDFQSPSAPHVQQSATSPEFSTPTLSSADPVQSDASQIDSEIAKPPPNTENINDPSSSTTGQVEDTQANGDRTSISSPGVETKDGSHAPSNAAEVFSEAQQDQTDDNNRPMVTFSGANGQQHSGVLTGGNVIVDSTVTISQGGAKSSVTGIGVVSAADSGLVISQENVKVTAAYSSDESIGPAAAVTTALITFEGSTYTVVQSSRIGAQEASFESHSVEVATFEAGGNVFTAYRPVSDGAVRVIAEETTFSLERGSTTNIDDHSISADPTGKLAFDGKNLAYTSLDQPALPSSSGVIFTANDGDMYTVVQNSGTDLLVHNSGSTFTIPASSSATVGGSEIRVGASDNVLVDSETLAPSALPSASAGQQVEFTVDGKIRTTTEHASGSAAAFDGTTVSVGGPALTPGDETVSMATGGLVLQSNGKQDTITFAQAQAQTQDTAAILTLGANGMTAYAFGSDVTAAPSGVILDGTTLLAGGSAVTISGNTISLASSGIIIANDGSTSTILLPTASSLPESKAVLTLGSRTFTAYQVTQSPGVVDIGGSRLSIGGQAITINGEVISAASSGVVEDGTLVSWSTIPVPAMTSDTPGSTTADHGGGTIQRSRTSAESSATQRESGIATTTSGAERHRTSVVRLSLVAVGLVFVTLF
ncbi:hypothetical protein KC343_g6004 [Hortaea werneckii]|nr:hypothetical protein KC338_g6443 [Hortaea werneckii]KAI7216892.1 hypothetical protein KC352_g16578 [Hortaea werneckii]KAI7565847.1 hypothetical protein KC317_g6083 [Hortaea werneckii]KAI7620263.1 hypothetical protein KC346_g4206 [Hortaea werneckii]KAI7627413.1 hypothetical protein KC343_g6004 [Hortaea werneckii]